VSWAAHELESYVLQRHTGDRVKVSYLAILLGCLLPDLMTKLPVYGVTIGSFSLKASYPAQYHRGWPGVGFTHSLIFGVLVALLVLWRTKSKAWALGLLIGQWAHVLTDVNDTVGTMLFFPFSLQNYSTNMWAYAAQAGRYGDAAAYYSSLGGVWDLFWLLVAAFTWRVFTRDYFFDEVVPADPAWGWLRRRFDLSDRAMLLLYRGYFFYGACRIFAWTIWAHAVDHAPWDLTWGGPSFVQAADLSRQPWSEYLLNTLRGAVLMALALWLLWRFLGRRLWARAA
jgi:membrane-bound metal-dependent hydrolase YbcI (DUF457 family)